MAELQQRTQAYDLAIENIYSDFRRRVSSLVGLDNTTTTRHELARRIAERTGDDQRRELAERSNSTLLESAIAHGKRHLSSDAPPAP